MKKLQIYMRVDSNGNLPEDSFAERIRLIYPNGEAEWETGERDISWFRQSPCWHPGTSISQKKAVALMKEYDKMCGWKTVKIGEI